MKMNKDTNSMRGRKLLVWTFTMVSVAGALSCQASNAERVATQRQRVEADMKALISEQLEVWQSAADELQQATPTPSKRGWDRAEDAAAISAMKAAWQKGRDAYERVEGAIAPLFPESDAATDARYDDFLLRLGAVGDPTPFDGEGVVGMHAIERILWADSTPATVVEFEKSLPGYRPARVPESAEDARRFRDQLVGRLSSDISRLRQEFAPLSLDVAFAFQGTIDLAMEQVEKVDKASTGQEESRYAQSTMRDLRNNYQGCLDAYRLFQPWLRHTADGRKEDTRVLAAFERLRAAYAAVEGMAIPEPPPRWSSLTPHPDALETPFGKLFRRVKSEADPEHDDSLVAGLYRVARTLELRDVVVK
jgi:iron uptake system component EfeO